MSSNSLALANSNYLKSESSLYLPTVQSYLKVPASFWICLSCFSVQR